MNKYQEALKTFKHVIRKLCSLDDTYYQEEFELEEKALKELVDKATPFKPLNQRYDNIRDIAGGKCKCNSTVYESHMFCPDCGQALDWSEDESK